MTKQQLRDAGLTPIIIAKLAIAVEQGCDEETQRGTFGDDTVDWVKEAYNHLEFTDDKDHKTAMWRVGDSIVMGGC